MDSSGKVVIAPAFLAAGDFSEGMAEARVTGTYGYIDATGEFVIPPQFDFATPFSGGLAVVYKDGLPFYINKKGARAFEVSYKELSPFIRGRARVVTATGKTGIIDPYGKLVIDTAFKKIGTFIYGAAVVEGMGHQPYPRKGEESCYEVGIINNAGHFLVPYGIYTAIHDPSDGYFNVAMPGDSLGRESVSGYLNIDGKLVLKTGQQLKHLYGDVKNGLIKAVLAGDSSEEDVAFIDISGKIIFHNEYCRNASDFSDNRSFVFKDKNLVIINVAGKQVTDQAFDQAADYSFAKGVAVVKYEGKWGLIDTGAHFLISPQYEGALSPAGDDFYFFQKYDRRGYYRYGIVKKTGQVIFPACMDSDNGTFKDGLLLCHINERYTYINRQGNVVWQEQKDSSLRLTDLNVDYRLDGYFYAYSIENLVERRFSMRNAELDNYPRQVSTANAFPAQVFGIRVETAARDTFEKSYHGRRIEVFNTTADTIHFDAQNSRLYMKTQALDLKGNWQDVEHLSGSWCGNSYHQLSLPPGQYWPFTAPVYAGDILVKMRIALTWLRDGREPAVVYSPVFDGNLNPAQCWRKPDLHSNNIMDPTIY